MKYKPLVYQPIRTRRQCVVKGCKRFDYDSSKSGKCYLHRRPDFKGTAGTQIMCFEQLEHAAEQKLSVLVNQPFYALPGRVFPAVFVCNWNATVVFHLLRGGGLHLYNKPTNQPKNEQD